MGEKSGRDQVLVEARRAVLGLEGARTTIAVIRAGLRREMPTVMRELEEAEEELPRLQEEAKAVLRRLGPGDHEVVGHSISVRGASTKVECDVEGLVDRARDRGEIDELLDAGVLRYDVTPYQIARLSSVQQAIYQSYLREQPGTAAVLLPPELK